MSDHIIVIVGDNKEEKARKYLLHSLAESGLSMAKCVMPKKEVDTTNNVSGTFVERVSSVSRSTFIQLSLP